MVILSQVSRQVTQTTQFICRLYYLGLFFSFLHNKGIPYYQKLYSIIKFHSPRNHFFVTGHIWGKILVKTTEVLTYQFRIFWMVFTFLKLQDTTRGKLLHYSCFSFIKWLKSLTWLEIFWVIQFFNLFVLLISNLRLEILSHINDCAF